MTHEEKNTLKRWITDRMKLEGHTRDTVHENKLIRALQAETGITVSGEEFFKAALEAGKPPVNPGKASRLYVISNMQELRFI